MSALILLVLLMVPRSAWAAEAHPLADHPEIEARVTALATELRCLVCQNQTLADSQAPLAEDMRREIRRMVADGRSDRDIIEFLVARYGDFVRYRPPVKGTTVLLWFGPVLFLAAGAGTAIVALRRGRQQAVAGPLSEEERRRVEHLVRGGVNHP